ncbi:MAG: hypothetical protein JST50_20630 [Bacteroidetes bacterium]|jgi:hypothetical protein|nr:hypothetical protein [Bacteroidota bacterium]
MNKQESIQWGAFKQALLQNPSLDLQFQYARDKWVTPSYHITEIKQAPITSVDCGGVKNEWTEIIIQLMEPANQQQLRAMKVRKALSIIDIVEKVMPLDINGVVRIEFGNNEIDTRQLSPTEFISDEENLIVNLQPVAVQCKANDRGGSCGGPVKQKIELKNLTADSSCCTPGGGCC